MVSRFGDDGAQRVPSAKALATVLHLQRGTPYVYQGEELGMTNAGFTRIEEYRDIESLNHYGEAVHVLGSPPELVLAALRRASRDNARTPMQWSTAPHAGFTTGSPWIGVNPNYRQINAAAEVDDPDSVFAYYRALIDLRHRDEVVSSGTFELVLAEDPQIFGYVRALGSRRLLVLANLTGEAALYDGSRFTEWKDARFVLGNLDDASRHADGALAPWQALVLEQG